MLREPFTSKVTEPPFLPQNYQREHSTVNLTLEKRIKCVVLLWSGAQLACKWGISWGAIQHCCPESCPQRWGPAPHVQPGH